MSPPIADRITRRPLAEFIRHESVGGLALVLATLAALVWVNVASGSYDSFWTSTVGTDRWFDLHLDLSLHAWVNDALMTVFFFVVGLEIKRELVVGELANPRVAIMPAIAALGGMVVPALIYLALNGGGSGHDGWGIPIATDIAFVLGALSLLGSRAPAGLRVFLLALAIIDDIGAIVVIALFYADQIEGGALVAAAGTIAVIVALRISGVSRPAAYVVPAIALWLLVHESGVHATIAGVVLGMLTPARPVQGRPVLDRLQHRLHPLSALVIVPLFALANAGVVLRADSLRDAAGSPITWGVVLGLVVGKTAGITGASLVARRLGVGALPPDVGTRQLIGGAALAGIGFTVSLFVAELTFRGSDRLTEAKIGIVSASLLAGAIGALVLRGRRGGRNSANGPFRARPPAPMTAPGEPGSSEPIRCRLD